MIHFMEQTRGKHLAREHTAMINSRKAVAASLLRTYKLSSSGTPYTTILPNVVDFYKFDPVRRLLDLPDEVNVDEHSFASIVPQIDASCQAWCDRIHDELIQVVGHPDPSSLQTTEQKVAFLKLARNVFFCESRCRYSWIGVSKESKLYYPQVLARQYSVIESDFHEDDPPDSTISLWCWRRSLDRDPEQTAVDDMDKLEQLYQCSLCEHNGFLFVSGKVIYGWRAFVSKRSTQLSVIVVFFQIRHLRDEHALHVENNILTLMTQKDFEAVPMSDADGKLLDWYKERDDLRWRCLRCRHLSSETETCSPFFPGIRFPLLKRA